ncbi:MAG: relaxase/mobilization nuclease domain-containing protein [Enterocloster bolteae]
MSYLLIQSFRPGEITLEEANRLGYQLALNYRRQHQFIVATHIDKHHIHCHIEFNSTTLTAHKFNNYWNTYKTIRHQ